MCIRDRLAPAEYIEKMKTMCQSAPTSSFDEVRMTIQESFGKPLEEIFSEFSPLPISSASIAQVHVATLKSTGERVAVKVQHRWLRESVGGDLKMIDMFVNVGEMLFTDFKYRWLAEELRESLPRELDFVLEGKNADQIRELFKTNISIKVPKINWETTNEKVLCMEFMDGFSIVDTKKIKEHGLDTKEIARLLSTAFAEQIFHFGFVHGDPHQGNIFVRPIKVKGAVKPQIVLLDHGLYKTLSPHTRYNYAKLWKGIFTQDEDLIKRASIKLGAEYDYPLFISMITSKTYDEVINSKERDLKKRLNPAGSEEEKNQLSKYVVLYHKEIIDILNKINRDLMILFKCNEFLRSLDNQLGSPINTFKITADYCFSTVREEEKHKKQDILYDAFYYISLFKAKMKLILFELYLRVFRLSPDQFMI
eukprot:TRINITY_DN9094_c0_g1_i3.p1 TRINITY_DN9094_c0_g1~~TRINITY_DN9094_c0_g1_i3.p1  ORF type:complete len:422 (-),score=107.55 TRINITY_DN9094_c0_g1_i3:344-1609(-)